MTALLTLLLLLSPCLGLAVEIIPFINPKGDLVEVNISDPKSITVTDSEGVVILRPDFELRKKIISEIIIRNGGLGKNEWIAKDKTFGGPSEVLIINDRNDVEYKLWMWDNLDLVQIGETYLTCRFPFMLVIEDRIQNQKK